jgi:citrate synthase
VSNVGAVTQALELRPGLADVPVAESAVSFIDGKRARLEYRGIAVETLARESCFEETAWLLLKGQLPTQRELAEFDDQLRHHRRLKFKIIDLLKCLPETGHPMGALQAGVAALGMFYPARDVSNEKKNWECVVRLIAKLPTLVAAFHRLRRGDDAIQPRDDLDHAANFYYMLFDGEPTPASRRVLDACLILHAEHTMNASTFSGRVTASTLADPYTVVSSAIGTLTGPLHGGANEEVLAMLAEIKSVEDVQPWLQKKLAADPKFKIMGFGHRVYKVKDPRATVLQELAEHVFAETTRPKNYDIAVALEKLAGGPDHEYAKKGVFPNVDYYSGIVYESLGIPRDLFTPIFAISRVAGWLSHWLEQLKNNKIYRPEQVYVGKRDQPYVALEKRP